MADERLHQQLDEMHEELKRLREENARIRRMKENEASRGEEGKNIRNYGELKRTLRELGGS